MAQVSFDIEGKFQDQFTEMLTNVARQAIETARKQDANFNYREWLKQKEVCEWLNISYLTLNGWKERGMKVSIVAGITLISKDEINRFLIEHQQ